MRMVVIVLLAPATAFAGRQPFTYVQDVEVVPERIVELQAQFDDTITSKRSPP